MELGGRELIQLFSLIASLAGAFAVVRSQLKRIIIDVSEIEQKMSMLETKLDKLEAGQAVDDHQLKIIGSILSPDNLGLAHETIADIKARLSISEKQIEKLASMHNGTHQKY